MLLLVARGGLVVAFERGEFGKESVLSVATALLVAFGGGEGERPPLLESAKGAEEVPAGKTVRDEAELVHRLQRLGRWCRPPRQCCGEAERVSPVEARRPGVLWKGCPPVTGPACGLWACRVRVERRCGVGRTAASGLPLSSCV